MILTFKEKEWDSTINNLLMNYAKKNNQRFYFNEFFKLLIEIDSKTYSIDTYYLNKDILTIKLKEEFKKWVNI